MSSFLEEAQGLAKKRGGSCMTCAYLAALPDDIRDEVVPVIDGHLAPATGVMAALERRGHRVPSESSFLRHWNGGCKGTTT
jgi:Asp/Glu/hydantoin racemase